ncbi:MAG: NAD(P)(+) transhydrogenase (Re/Si-specific) subunit beta [Spirochaetota bacterium]|nr:NAD(P)(+) transhydrogenase (Re/Si-specific) subunit beta [Spirochaetota bacterium]
MTETTIKIISNVAYLIASIFFIIGLKGLAHPRTAVRGNLLGAIGMLIAIITVLWANDVLSWYWIIAGIVVGSGIGAVLSYKIEMTAMPQLVALFNGFGGLASVLIGGAALLEVAGPVKLTGVNQSVNIQLIIATIASGLIGAVTFWGSFIAFGKLQGLKFIPDAAVRYPGEQIVKLILILSSIVLGVFIVMDPVKYEYFYWIIVVLSSVLGVLLVIAIGGADMPVVIALLNSYSGIAGAATGFIDNNYVLIIAGSLVGASGIILTQLMCKAMNRSLANVLFGGFGAVAQTSSADEVYGNKIKAVTADDIAIFLDTAQKVVIIPGYGMAVGQAQHAVKDLTVLLESKGIDVEFAIHPVAGRMPGHMNVLLAEVDIPYDKLKEMDEINQTLSQVDVAIVLGANDVVNTDARDKADSPIAGMPIIDADKAKTVIIIKRSLSPGFAGIPNPLFALDNSYMFFSDGKKAVMDIVTAVKNL